MQLRADIQIKSILKAMADVVLPAVDPGNQLAQEQARLCMGLLDLMARQLPLQYRFDVDELGRLLGLANELHTAVTKNPIDESTAQALAKTIAQGQGVYARAQADPAEVLEALRALRSTTSAVVTQVCTDEKRADLSAVEQLVMASSHEQLQRDRSWLLAQRWEPNPEALPAIETLLAPLPGAAS